MFEISIYTYMFYRILSQVHETFEKEISEVKPKVYDNLVN